MGQWVAPGGIGILCEEVQKIMENDILERLRDLLEQATKERSHYYVASTALFAIAEIERLREIEFMYEGLCK